MYACCQWNVKQGFGAASHLSGDTDTACGCLPFLTVHHINLPWEKFQRLSQTLKSLIDTFTRKVLQRAEEICVTNGPPKLMKHVDLVALVTFVAVLGLEEHAHSPRFWLRVHVAHAAGRPHGWIYLVCKNRSTRCDRTWWTRCTLRYGDEAFLEVSLTQNI